MKAHCWLTLTSLAPLAKSLRDPFTQIFSNVGTFGQAGINIFGGGGDGSIESKPRKGFAPKGSSTLTPTKFETPKGFRLKSIPGKKVARFR